MVDIIRKCPALPQIISSMPIPSNINIAESKGLITVMAEQKIKRKKRENTYNTIARVISELETILTVRFVEKLEDFNCNAAFDVTTKLTFNRKMIMICRSASFYNVTFPKVTLSKGQLYKEAGQLLPASFKEKFIHLHDESSNLQIEPNIAIIYFPNFTAQGNAIDNSSQNLDISRFSSKITAIKILKSSTPIIAISDEAESLKNATLSLSYNRPTYVLSTTEEYLIVIWNHLLKPRSSRRSSLSSRTSKISSKSHIMNIPHLDPLDFVITSKDHLTTERPYVSIGYFERFVFKDCTRFDTEEDIQDFCPNFNGGSDIYF
ncbi:hypothetical protein RF11_06413 [Thelohanellus kitauei]|uniref:Uncharacterized protein n=1 Tax=Thelohanellus kitauei TaxID=669202 RepID=A0A0C2JT46_THEKT|nr:hypothetical protein RF11_06413 [Thelohanellus kitauei]